MQYRQPRLGDIVDDYCPRERRLTNHAVVAMVGPDIKQTRCTTCDTEHEYKHAKVPAARKKKDAAPALYKQVLASAQPESVRAAEAPGAAEEPPAVQAAPSADVVNAVGGQTNEQPLAATEPDGQGEEPEPSEGDDDGPVHRRLIRATLPRTEGQVPRPLPQFTVRQPGKFGGNARGGGRPPGNAGTGSRPRAGGGRAAFGRNGSREAFSTRPSGNPHHPAHRSRPAHQSAGRPLRHGKKSSK
jgi:hypothetical protein